MKRIKTQKKATTFQIVGTFLVVISAFILIAYVFIDQVRKDILSYKEGAKEYSIIAARKVPEYTQLSSEEGAYQAIYEVGMRGGYQNKSYNAPTSVLDFLHILYAYTPPIDVPTAVWADEALNKATFPNPATNRILKIPNENTVRANISDIIKNETLARWAISSLTSGADTSFYENATYTTQRTKCITTEYLSAGQGCLNTSILTYANYTQLELSTDGTLQAKTAVVSTTTTYLNVRFMKMYDMLKTFINNNFIVRTGSNLLNYNLLAKQLGETLTCAAGNNCDWDEKSATVEFCPTTNDCTGSVGGSGLDANVDYQCVPTLNAPACNTTIKNNLKTKIQEIESEINRDAMFFPYVVLCPSTVPDCEADYYGGYSLEDDPKNGGNSYRSARFKWTIAPDPNKTWEEAIHWEGSSDDYNVLWWAQDNANGQCTLPTGYVYKTDTQPLAGTVSVQNDYAKDSWTKTDFLGTQLFPEGTACADAYYVNCHKALQYWTKIDTCSPSSCYTCSGSDPHPSNSDPAWCEEDAYSGDYAHSTCGGQPYGGTWCSAAQSLKENSYAQTCSWSCPWTTCSCGYSTCAADEYVARVYTGNVLYTHCDVKYDFKGHFKYRAKLDPLMITLTDESRTMPVKDIYGNIAMVKPQLKSIYKGWVYEEPAAEAAGARCVDREGDEDKSGSRYYHASDDAEGNECPKQRNATAPNPNYYGYTVC